MFMQDRHFAHAFLFGHRHPLPTPAFHFQLIDSWHSNRPRVLNEIFRGGGKSTLSEEDIALIALLREYDYPIIIGETYEKACDRLGAIKSEIQNNEKIHQVFGNQVGSVWRENEILLKNGTRIKAFGRGQSIRGEKDERSNVRPDFALIDDLENKEAVASPEARAETVKWLNRELIPAMKMPMQSPIRVNGTRLHPESLIVRLANDPEWYANKVPVERKTEGGRVAAWDAKFPLDVIDNIRSHFERDGDLNGFAQEYLCESVDEAERPFQPRHIHVEPVAGYHIPRWLIVDPARSVRRSSARTGYLDAGWDRRKLVFFNGFGGYDKPDKIVKTIFDTYEQNHRGYVQVGVEKDGLEEFLMQPIRAEMLRRGVTLPLLPLMAPKDRNKQRFILGLLPFFEAGDVVFARPLPELEKELLNFPQGLVDVLNCAAYMLKVRTGDAVYEDFNDRHVIEGELNLPPGQKYLAVNGDAGECVFAACHFSPATGKLFVVADAVSGVEDQQIQATLGGLRSSLGDRFDTVMPSSLFDRQPPIVGYVRRHQLKFFRGSRADAAAGILQRLMTTFRRGDPLLQVSADARWTVNALGAGYRRPGTPDGGVGQVSASGTYGLIGTALDVLAAFVTAAQDGDGESRFAYTPGGQRYRTALPE